MASDYMSRGAMHVDRAVDPARPATIFLQAVNFAPYRRTERKFTYLVLPLFFVFLPRFLRDHSAPV